MNLKNSKTFTNLARAYAGESCARNRYTMLAQLAEKEGYVCVKDALKTIAHNEFNHARMIFSFIDSADAHVIDNIEIKAGFPFKQKLQALTANLILAEQDELNEANKIYPEFAKVAKEEGFTDIANFFTNLIQIETCHSKMLNSISTQLKDGTMYKRNTPIKWKCRDCGYESTSKQAFEICPVCQAPQGYVMLNFPDQN